MKSYIEPISAADALDVLRVFCEPFGDLSYSYNNDEDAVLHGPDGDKVLKTPDEVIAVMGDDATREIAEHKRFRERAVRELMVPVLSEWGSIYNVRTGETFILDSNCEGKLYGFYCTETPLATLVDEGEDGIPYDAALYAIETRGADMQHLDALPGSELPDPLAIEAPVADDDFVGAIDTVLCYMEQTAIDLELGGDLFDLSGWTLADGKSIAATCSRLGIDASPKLHTDPASVADFVETVWGCTSLEPVKARHFGVSGFRGLEFSFRDGAETRMRAWQFDACPKVAAALAAALTYRCEKGFYMEAGCAGDQGGVWGLSFDRKERGAYAVARFHPERATYDPHGREVVSRCPILLEQDANGNIAFRHPGTVPDRLIDNFIPSMKRCDVAGGGPTCKTERGPEGAAMRASRPGGVNISFPALVERAQAAALATARGATTAAGNRL